MSPSKKHESIDELSNLTVTQLKVLDEEAQDITLEGKTAFNDSELFIRKAFEESPQKGCEMLFRRYHKILCSHAVRFVYSKELAEDLVSEVFCRFWKTKAYLTVTSSYRFYLFRCVRNEAYNHIRSEFKQLDELDSAIHFESALGQRPDSITQFEEVFHQVEELVESLSPQCRKVFLLNRFEGKKYQEVATELNISIKTVEVHIGKALAIIRKGLKEHWLISMVLFLMQR
ncbi:RNA polymerase sigma-70 factor [Arcicella aquatica]|uniref:RNA polymerase sigma-70 factor n=1 Tax=Arcicella aquatica TaxID=217141 RepID=A0ABU5QPR6_9BACT|nr:RNA polymerase sigma-70 factor [Arcicella aquatica]MEA5259076.1 RNA polymerase sigma-70 factor [Arcicella aquatica]